ncbi:MAG TPA: Asp-tRNA(Asn)/Glu-tRNA(Gln) amidotransferase subunit GatB [Solirubrobacteraceae bacterium]|nr:Asp-tRNA(Asn)/Glu-tRNA(Gln) amidotransferase subunit GatB [Solirubrobacteraceae bacterium]
MSAYEPVIGLEIHVQLATATKMFCSCAVAFGAEPNTLTCPVCLGLPGALPVANAQAVHFGLMIGQALGSELAPRSIFHRKNYFYPDLPKGYQISQYDEPLCRGGELEGVRIHRVHLEEDAAKLIHVGASGRIHGSETSLVDFNRGGTPLVEIVTEPDLRSAEQAGAWLRLLRATLRELGVSDVNMEEGSLRADANVSIRPVGSTQLGVKTELKNMNSFRFLERGIAAEIARQEAIVEGGGEVAQETLHFDPASGSLEVMRSKEQAHDYRYFPEPDLPPVLISEAMVKRARAAIPELPSARARRLRETLALPEQLARQLAFRGELYAYFEASLAAAGALQPTPEPRLIATWLSEELLPRAAGELETQGGNVPPAALAQLVALLAAGRLSVGGARQVLERMLAEGGDPAQIAAAEGLEALSDEGELARMVAEAIAANPQAAEQVRAGEGKAIGPIVGHVMRASRGRADGQAVSALIREQLGL